MIKTIDKLKHYEDKRDSFILLESFIKDEAEDGRNEVLINEEVLRNLDLYDLRDDDDIYGCNDVYNYLIKRDYDIVKQSGSNRIAEFWVDTFNKYKDIIVAKRKSVALSYFNKFEKQFLEEARESNEIPKIRYEIDENYYEDFIKLLKENDLSYTIIDRNAVNYILNITI